MIKSPFSNIPKIVYRYDRLTKNISFKTFLSFNRELHNFEVEKYLYFNYNLITLLWENNYCTAMTHDVEVALSKVKNVHLMIEIVNHHKDLYNFITSIKRKNDLKLKYETAKKRIKLQRVPIFRAIAGDSSSVHI